MGHPGPIEAIVRLADLVVTHLAQGDLVHLRILPGGDERRHPAERERAALVAGPDQELRVRAHERDGHRDLDAVGEQEVRAAVELLDRAEDEVPASGVESR